MPTFIRWLAAVVRHFVLLIGGTIAGVIGLYVQQYTPDGRIPAWPFYGLCAVALGVALFATWRDEYDRAQGCEAQLLNVLATHAREVEWARAIDACQSERHFPACGAGAAGPHPCGD